ncbi:hypothetical protein BOX15_Mlig003815g1 [Macrostomum lignano]|uniref:Uncharacterized protein n=2 Tax=Macrostomum lignano TaxID=282301 RepID=A0A267GE87_9PLAT|nr:hypothetical protein BOX15_Mlig003815g1 [Macrostomum lignano]
MSSGVRPNSATGSSQHQVDSVLSAAVYSHLQRLVGTAAAKLRTESESIDESSEKAAFHRRLVSRWLAAHRLKEDGANAKQQKQTDSPALTASQSELLVSQLRSLVRQEAKLLTKCAGEHLQSPELREAARREKLRLLDEAAEAVSSLEKSVSQLTQSLLDLVPAAASTDAASSSLDRSSVAATLLRDSERLRSHCVTLLVKLKLDTCQVRQATYSAERLKKLQDVRCRIVSQRAELLDEINRLREMSLRYQASEAQAEYRRLMAAQVELGKSVQLLKYSLGYDSCDS